MAEPYTGANLGPLGGGAPDAWDAFPDKPSSKGGDQWDAFPDTKPLQAQEAADHGLSERQKLSPLGKALSPVTSYWDTYQRMNKDAREQISRGAEQVSNPDSLTDPQAHGISDVVSGAGNVALGTLGYVASPLNAAYRSIAGQPIEDVTGIPREHTEFAAQLATPGIGLPGTVKAPAPNFPRSVSAPTNEITDAARRVSAVAPETVNVPKAFASDNMAVQRTAQGIRNIPIVGDAIPKATGEMADQLGGAVKGIASNYGEGSGPNVANRISNTLGTAAEREAQAARAATDSSDAAVLADWERAHTNTRNAIGAAETNAADTARRVVGDMSPQDMGATLNARLRAGEAEARATKDRLYGVAGDSDASITAAEVGNVRARVAQGLEDAGVIVDPGTAASPSITPAANRMMNVLQDLAELRIPNRAVGASVPGAGDIAAVSAQGLEQARKRLVFARSGATNDADRRAATHIMRQFEEWQSHAYETALFSGSDEALTAFREARAANASWRQRFFNDENNAGKFITRIVSGEITPQETANFIVGSGKVGAKGEASRLLTGIAEATGNDPETLQAIRGGVWNRLSQSTAGVDAKGGAKVANDINEFLQGSGRDVANRLFTPVQQGVMRTYADTLRRGGQARETLEEVARTTKPSALSTQIGPMEDLANAVLGKGGKSDEALFNAIDSYAKSGSRADVKTLADIVRNIPAQDRGNLAGAMISKLGYSKQANGFSLDMFASQWADYTPQAKAVLFGNAGPHRQALDDIAKISQRYKDIGKRFGNPSGSAQNVNFTGAAAMIYASPFTAIPTLLGGTIAARMLASPAGASSLSKWGKASMVAQASPTPQRLVAFQIASRNLSNTASGFGANISPSDLIRSIQGMTPTRANDEQPKPERVINR
jgi:hypothetical protein